MVALHHQGRHGHGRELREPGLLGAARRVYGKREAQHSGRPGVRGSPARDSGAEGASTGDQRLVAEFRAQVLSDGTPRGIHLSRRGGRLSARDPVGLLDQRDREARTQGHLGGQAQIVSGHSTAGSVAEHHQPDWFIGRTDDVDPRVAVRRRDEGAGEIGHAETVRATRQTGGVQTFLPFADFERSARALDRQRLGKQRVETIQVVRALTWPDYGWANHPAVLMWKGFEEALGRYGFTCCEAWIELGFGDTCAATIATDLRAAGVNTVRTQADLAAADALPPWLGDDALHRSHQSSLLRKDPDHYRPLFPDVPDDLPYVWPVRSEKVIAAEQRRAENEVRRQERAVERERLDAEKLRRKRSRAAKKAWKTRRQNTG